MNLLFLNPWFWLGAFAIAAPIWLHLRRRKERNLIRFSAVRFLCDQPKARRSPLSVRDFLLLLLRVMAVLVIVGAFAWPYLRAVERHSASRSVVYILDNTFSHQANDGFRRDQETLVHNLSAAAPSTKIGVIELTAAPRVVVGFTEERGTAIQRVRELRPSFQRGSYLAAFREANDLLGEISSGNKQIVLLGDSQANQWQENLAAAPFLRHVQIELPKPAEPQLPNLWLSEPNAQRIFLGEKSLVNLTFRLGHSGPARKARVSLRVNDRTIFEREIDFDNQPRTMLLQGQCEADPASWLQAQASVEGAPDSLQGDNQLYFAMSPVLEGKVALLAQSPFLRVGLSPDVMRGQWRTRVLDPGKLDQEANLVPQADVLCIESAFLQGTGGRAILKRYLEAGRGVLLCVNRLSPAIDACLRENGFEPEGMVQPAPSAENFQFVSSSHSIFRPFQSPDFGQLGEVTISRYARLQPLAGRPLAFSQSGSGLFFESTKYPGKFFVAAFGLDREHTSWPVHQTFIPFLDLVLQAARPQDSTRLTFEPGETAIIQVPAEKSIRTIALRENGREIGHAAVTRGQSHLRMPDAPGLYTIGLDQDVDNYRIIAINPSAKESELVYLDSPKPIHDWSLAPRDEDPKSAWTPDRTAVGFSSVLKQQIWWWLVAAALLALALETSWVVAKGEHA